MTSNVFNHDDRIVDQNADREYQREEADTVDRVAHHHRRKERQQDRRRNDDERDQCLTPANRKGDEDND